MALQALLSVFSLLTLFRVTSAQIGPDPRWSTPDGSQKDFTFAYSAGDTITLSWQTLNASRCDLWLTHWDTAKYTWYASVAKNVDVSAAGTLSWYIDVPATTIQSDNRFVLRFYPVNTIYGGIQMAQFDSPGFLLAGGSKSSTSLGGAGTTATQVSNTNSAVSTQSAGVSSSSAFSTSIISSSRTTLLTTTNAAGNIVTATVTTSIPSSTDVAGSSQTASSSSSSANLSVAAQAGIGVAAGLFVILLFIGGCFFGRRYGIGKKLHSRADGYTREGFHTQQSTGSAFAGTMAVGPTEKTDKSFGMSEMSDTTESASLMHHHGGTPRAEISGDNAYPIEKSGAMVRPGVHEIG